MVSCLGVQLTVLDTVNDVHVSTPECPASVSSSPASNVQVQAGDVSCGQQQGCSDKGVSGC